LAVIQRVMPASRQVAPAKPPPPPAVHA